MILSVRTRGSCSPHSLGRRRVIVIVVVVVLFLVQIRLLGAPRRTPIRRPPVVGEDVL
jgi:hypothetical protein